MQEKLATAIVVVVLTSVLTTIGCAHLATSKRVLQAQRIELTDIKGDVRGVLSAEPGGVAVTLLDREGHTAVTLEVRDDDPRDRPVITFFGADGEPTATLGYSSFSIVDAPDVAWTDKRPMLVFLGADGRVIWHAPPDLEGPWETARYIH